MGTSMPTTTDLNEPLTAVVISNVPVKGTDGGAGDGPQPGGPQVKCIDDVHT